MNIILNPVCNFEDMMNDLENTQDNCSVKQPKAKIGYIRADHDGYRWWTTYFPCREELKTEEIRQEMRDVCAEIIENMFINLEAVRKFCYSNSEAKTGEDTYSFYIECELCNYWVRFTTRRKDYNMYLHAYKK